MSIIKKVLANVVQTLTASEKAQARSNIGITPADISKSGMANQRRTWTDKAYGEDWKTIGTGGVQQYISVTEGIPTFVRLTIEANGYGFPARALKTIHVRLADGSDIFDDMWVDFLVTTSNIDAWSTITIVFFNPSPVSGNYSLQVSCDEVLSASEFVEVQGSTTGNVKAMHL